MPIAPFPTSANALVALADRCVQCGLCLPVCPTYRHDSIESESPRGRISLARAWSLEALEPTAAGDAHLDHCLACGACESVCPAGVEYGALLVQARAQQRSRRPPALRQRAVEWLVQRPRWLARVLALYRVVYPALPASLRPLPRPQLTRLVPTLQDPVERTLTPVAQPAVARPDTGIKQDLADAPASPILSPTSPLLGPQKVDLFVGCVAATFERPAREALARLLAAAGVAVRIPLGQTCCGAIAAHAGNTDAATALARTNAEAFEHSRTVLTLASGCHATVQAGLDVATEVMDALDFLAARAGKLDFTPATGRVALHLPCTQRNQVGSVPALRRLLARVPQLDLVELRAGFGCCGAAGMQMLDDPQSAASYRTPLLQQLEECGVTVLLSANIGCRLHLQNGTAVPVRHPLEFLAVHLREQGIHATSIN